MCHPSKTRLSLSQPQPASPVTHLVEAFVVPVRVEVSQHLGEAVVLSHHERVNHGQDQLLVHADLTLRKETVRL